MTEFKAPASQQEWDEMKKLLRREISDSDLENFRKQGGFGLICDDGEE